MKKLSKVFILCLLCLCPLYAQGQSFTVSGVVYDEEGTTFPGANVFLKNSAGIGTTTNMDGEFKIKVSKADVIVVSFIGYTNFEYRAEKEESNLRVRLSPAATQLDEVVVTGMGSQRKISLVGAISTVNVSEIQTPATSLSNMIGGRVPGVISMLSSGEPGKNISEFWVRGIGTFGASTSALVLIDGLEGDLNSVDPADVEAFSILKDASATAVYGVRGANGVVLVTTKRGQSGRLKLTARANFTIHTLNKMPEYLGAGEYALLANEARVVRGDEPIYTDTEMNYIRYHLDPDLYPDVDWQKEIIKRSGFQQTYYLSAQGGGEIARYFISLGLSNEDAAYKMDPKSEYRKNVGYNTYNYRANLDINLTKSTTLYFGVDGYLSQNNLPGASNTDNLWFAQSQLTPLTIPTKYSNGQLPAYGTGANYSPYVMLNHTGMGTNQTYTGKVTLAVTQDFSAWVKGLKLRVQGAYDNTSWFNENRYVLPEMFAASGRSITGDLITTRRVAPVTAQYSNSQDQYRKYHFESTLTYEKTIHSDHRVSGLVYYYMSDQKRVSEISGSSGVNLSMAAIPKRYQGISSRLTYGFQDTYMIDVNFGYTGSENFQPGRQFGFFPSVALGWVPSNYRFFKEKLPWFDFLKFRSSYGSVGSDRISSARFPYLTIITETAATNWTNINNGINESSIGADNLLWEKSIKADFGIEGRLWKERISFVVDVFNDQRDGIFQRRQSIPSYAGLLAMPFGNVGQMRSFGSDGNVAFSQVINKDWSFTVRANYTYSRNVIQNWEQAPQKYPYQTYNGYMNNVIRGYIATGLFRDEQDVTSSPVQTFGGKVLPGDIKYKDINGDGLINSDDVVVLSSPTYPSLMYGFGGEVKYKSLTLGILFKGTGNTDYFHVGQGGNGMGYVPFHNGAIGNVLAIAADQSNRWTPASYSGDPATENPNARFPRLTYGYNANNSQLSTWWKGNNKYLRLQEITLNYHLQHNFLHKAGISSADIQFVGSNLYVWDQVKLWDPEQANLNGRAYPIPARYTLQLYLNF
ncbi:MAG: TonB-dependent receptor SusC [Candidatus Ordinivivax streblomastigis]|uniref:TonB-dependent receptor SusC n=1 Tax=Candidatus Ordinivivax streblomastigis TaxID=2540710 RepID=A0A5M8NWE4_9BACT|nr:MAG: TonB-dependent receptor SusC [Candidatus Ordinivivax streblomastigis]